MKKVHITTLGCFKNQVESDVLSGQMINKEFQIIENPDEADVIIVNTCGFIEPAKIMLPFIPIKGIKINPAAKLPNIAPRLFAA